MQDSFGEVYVEKVCQEEARDSTKTLPYLRYFCNKKIKYVWDAGIMQFVKFR